MPPRDTEPDRQTQRPSQRWDAEPARESARRDTERRPGGSAFERDLRGDAAAGAEGGRDSGSQAHGPPPQREEHRPQRGASAFEASPPPHDPAPARRDDDGRWPCAEGRAEQPPARRGRSWTVPTASRTPSHASPDRSDDTEFDADYRQWREEQMRLLDLDYAQWRKERYRKFAEEFSQWRSQRLQPMRPPAPASGEDSAASMGELSALGTPAPLAEDRLRPPPAERSRPGGGLLGSLLGGHGARPKPRP